MPKTKTKRCPYNGCNEKIAPAAALIGQCKCGKCFCVVHRLPEAHECTFIKTAEQLKKDKEDKLKKLEEMKCIANKINKC
tara:strand:- start:5730 stop:5969 length:240 start_codon:yes stop_codon:yes gene_type:complete